MKDFIIKWLLTALGVAASIWIVPGLATVGENSTLAIALFALVLALINIFIKPLFEIISLPITVLTLGIFYLVLNALMLELAAWLTKNIFANGIAINDFFSAVLGSLVISIFTAIAISIVENRKE